MLRLKEEEKAKSEELIQIQKELRRHETALESLKRETPLHKQRSKAENGTIS